MKDYKNTLNLPHTDFPMRAQLPQREPEILKRWQKLNLYSLLREKVKGNPRFIFHDGPPYANARPHLGTALNKIIKDMVVKSKTLSGFDAPFIPGWDCHGLPIELNVEKKIGKPGNKLSPKEFREACRAYAAEQVTIQREDFQRLGVMADWLNPYLTMDFHYEANTLRALGKIIANGHLLRGHKPVHWCTACGSALADTEVEYQDKTSPAIDVGFLIPDNPAVSKIFQVDVGSNPIFVPIWTTTPWTLPANQAVAVNPHFEYVLADAHWRDGRIKLICAQKLLTTVMSRYVIEDYKILATVNGESLEGLQCCHPYLDKRVPIILGDHVTTEAGTGAVHTAPAHGQDDYVVGQKYQLPMENEVNFNSCFNKDVPLIGGLPVFKANEVIIAELEKNHRLFHYESIQHSYPHCWRHKTPLIFRATPQWFISMDQKGLRHQVLAAVDRAQWLPSWGKTRISRMLESRPDWCISRQRVWGVPIPLFIHKNTGELHPETLSLIEKIAQRVEKEGVEAWFSLDTQQLLGSESHNYEKLTDVLDVWFDSGVSHYCVLAQRPALALPADLYFEGSDQHRGWFQTSLITSMAITEELPFKKVLTHGYVVDGEGKKMSKSLGNVVLPIELIKSLGADVVRLWVASSDYKLDINYSEEIIRRSVDAYRRIRNTARFLLANIFDFDPLKDSLPPEKLLSLDRWVLTETQTLQEEIISAYNDYNFPALFQKIHNFCSVQLGGFYLDIVKDRQYTSYRGGIARRSAQTAMYHIIEALVRWLAPMISFTAEEIWQSIPGPRTDSVFLTVWYDLFPVFHEKSTIDWSLLIPVRNAVNKIFEKHRQAGRIGSALEAEIILYADESLFSELTPLGNELRFVLITSEAQVKSLHQCPPEAELTDYPGLSVVVEVSPHKKCIRCWQRREDVGALSEHPEICSRCVENLSSPGENRYFA